MARQTSRREAAACADRTASSKAEATEESLQSSVLDMATRCAIVAWIASFVVAAGAVVATQDTTPQGVSHTWWIMGGAYGGYAGGCDWALAVFVTVP